MDSLPLEFGDVLPRPGHEQEAALEVHRRHAHRPRHDPVVRPGQRVHTIEPVLATVVPREPELLAQRRRRRAGGHQALQRERRRQRDVESQRQPRFDDVARRRRPTSVTTIEWICSSQYFWNSA